MGYGERLIMKILITGCCGFLGVKLVNELLKRGYKVVGVDLSDKFTGDLGTEYDFKYFKLDLRNEEEVMQVFEECKTIDLIIHTAAIQPTSSKMDLAYYIDTNTLIAINLSKASVKYNITKIIYNSSFSVYSEPIYLPIDEHHETKPRNPYGVSKLFGEQVFEYYHRKHKIDLIILRMDGIYGNNQTIPGFIEYVLGELLTGGDIELYQKGGQKRDPVYVDDVVAANMLSIDFDSSFEVFNISGDDIKTSAKAVSIINSQVKSTSRIILSDKGNPMLSHDVYMSSSKAINKLGYKPLKLSENIIKMLKEKKELKCLK